MLAVADALAQAERAQGLLLKDLPTGVILLLAALIGYLLWEQRRISRELGQVALLCAKHMEKNTAASEALTKAVEAKVVAKRRGTPQLEAETKAGAAP